MYKQYLLDDSEVNKRNITMFGYDFYGPFRVVERRGSGKNERFTIIVSYIGKGAKAAAEEMVQRLNKERGI